MRVLRQVTLARILVASAVLLGSAKLSAITAFETDVTTAIDRGIEWIANNGGFTGGAGDASKSAVIWSESKGVPEIPSPLLLNDRIYLVKSGGVAICRDTKTGKNIFEERLGAEGGYFASPVAAGGRIYAASDRGTVTVFEAGDSLKILAKNELGEAIMATPAIVEGKLYVRTKTKLYAFKS